MSRSCVPSPSPSGAMPVLRRDVILGALWAAVAGIGSAGFPDRVFAQADITVQDFLHLSQRLTGADGLDPDVAKLLLGGFLATCHGPELRALAAGQQSARTPIGDAVVAAWYSGLYDTGHGTAVSDFNGALVWSALGFTKPFASCGGETGYWADPPET